MLLAQPFDPFKEQQEQQQQLQRRRKVSFFQVISRTRRALLDLKNRVHESKTHHRRQFLQNTALIMPDHHFMLGAPRPPPPNAAMPQPPWCGCYGCCYDPYILPPNAAGLMFPPRHHLGPAPPAAFHPNLPPPFQQQPHLSYSICVHLSPPPPPHHQQQQQQYQSQQQRNESSSLAESTLYSPGSSMYSGNEKELIEEVDLEEEDQAEEEEEHIQYNYPYPQQQQQYRSMPAMMMNRSNSESIVLSQQPGRRHTIHHRPSFNRWISSYN